MESSTSRYTSTIKMARPFAFARLLTSSATRIVRPILLSETGIVVGKIPSESTDTARPNRRRCFYEQYRTPAYGAGSSEEKVWQPFGSDKQANSQLSEMRRLVLEGYRNGKPTTTIVKEIQKVYGTNRRHAQLIARDQIAKLNSQICRMQQEDAGVTEYIWSTSGDSRVRSGHRKLNGKRFRWDDPPVVDDKTGRRCHPGEDYQCRCVALAVFDFGTIDLPISGDGGG